MRRECPGEGAIWWPNEPSLRDRVVANKARRGFTATGCHLAYGLKPTQAGWCWTVGVDGPLAQKYLSLTPEAVDFQAAPLDASWQRSFGKGLLMERTHAYPDLPVGPEALAWLVESVGQLRSVNLVIAEPAGSEAGSD